MLGLPNWNFALSGFNAELDYVFGLDSNQLYVKRN